MKVEVGKPQVKYQIRVMDLKTGEIMYQDDSFAGVICTVEKVTNFGAVMEGVHQVIAWGHPMVEFYAVDQLQTWFKKNGPAFLETLVKNGVIKGDTDWLKKIINGK